MAEPSGQRGGLMAAEVAAQPEVLARVLADGLAEVRAVADELRRRAPRFVLLAARGTSDHAALYGKYLLEVELGLPCGLASPSTYTAYGARPDLRDVLVVAVSQSGGSPDLLGTVEVAAACGATTLAVTNAPDSELARAAGLHLDVRAGTELSVAATKSYTAELLTLLLLVDAWAGGDAADARVLPDAVHELVVRRAEMAALAHRYERATRLVTTGRGFAYPTAREAALKVMETSYLGAHAFSGADLLHGPLAMLDRGDPVVAVVPPGVGATAMAPVLDRVVERGADLVVLGDAAPPDVTTFALPAGVSERAHPVVDIVALQWLALELALARGLDPDRPRGLAKLTQTW